MGQAMFFGLSESDFWRSSYRAVYNLIYTANIKEDNRVKQEWERTRTICQHIIAPYRKPGQEDKVFELPWDHDAIQIKEESPEEKEKRERVFAKMDSLMQKNGQK